VIGPLSGSPLIQLGFAVPDMDEALARMGGEWQTAVAKAKYFGEVTFRGQPAALGHLNALRMDGDVELEVIQPTAGPSVWHEWVEQGRPALHHLGLKVAEPLASIPAMEAAGFACVQRGTFFGDGEFAYFDTLEALGVYIEALRYPSSWGRA